METRNGRSLADLLADLIDDAVEKRVDERDSRLIFILFLLLFLYSIYYCSINNDLDYNRQGVPYKMDMQDKDEKQPKEDSVKVVFYKTD